MRITEMSVYRNGLYDLQQNQTNLTNLERQMSSGKQINQPSDNPAGTIDVLRLKQIISDSNAQVSNVNDGISWLNMADASLSQLTDVINRAKDLMTQSANGTYTATDDKALSSEVDQLIKTSLSVTNTQINGRYIFAGTKTNVQPFTQDTTTTPPTYSYQGSQGQVLREIAPGTTEGINVTIDNAMVGTNGLLTVLQNFKTALDNHDPTAIGSLMNNLQQTATAVQTTQADVGAKTNRMTSAQNNLNLSIDNFTKLLSDTEDVDVAKTYTELNVAQTTYTATLQTVSHIQQKSLLDYLK